MDEAESARSEKLAWPIALLVLLRAFEALVGAMLAGTLCMVAIFVTVPRTRDIR